MDLVEILSYLFGSEETVRHRRQLVFLREKIMNLWLHNFDLSVICSGSLGEGVASPISDDDVRYVVEKQSAQVYDSCREAIRHRALLMIPSDNNHGFCLIKDTKDPKEIGLAVMSSKLFREDFIQTMSGATPHGPCASGIIFGCEYDFVRCLFSPYWPDIASEWKIRTRRYGWPPQKSIETIFRKGCHIVPKGNPDSPLCDLEWRFSFSFAEQSLIHSFNHVQFVIYNLLKLILKRVINVQVPNVLCSYFIKTVLFYAIENTEPTLWANETTDECYRKCLSLLYDFVDVMNCPNYFIPKNNMIRRKVNTNNKGPLKDVISELMTNGIKGSLSLCGESNLLSMLLPHAFLEYTGDITLIYGYHWYITLVYSAILIENQMESNDTNDVKLRKILSIFQHLARNSVSSLSPVILRPLYFLGALCIAIANDGTKGNKSSYHMLKYAEVMLRIGRNIDITSGRLYLANYMFMTRKFRHCLAIIHNVFSKYELHVISPHYDEIRFRNYINLMCMKGFSLDYKVRTAWAFNVVHLPIGISLAPIPVRMLLLLTNLEISIPPLVYAYFLQGLCYYYIGDMVSMNTSVKELEDSVRYLKINARGTITCMRKHDIFYGSILLGYMKMLQRDFDFSCRCFTSAYAMKEDLEKEYKRDHSEDIKGCIILLACLLNHILNKM